MDPVITQSELDALLASLRVAESRRRRPSAEVAAALYDFRHAARLSPDHLRLLRGRTEALASVLSRTLTLYLNTTCEFRVQSLDLLSYEQLLKNLSGQAILAPISFGEGMPESLWELSHNLACLALDCMLGGRGAIEPGASPGTTPLEAAVLGRLFQEILTAWMELWTALQGLAPRVEAVVSQPSAFHTHARDERLLYVALQASLVGTEGRLGLSLPVGVVKRLLRQEKRTGQGQEQSKVSLSTLPSAGAICQAPVKLIAHFTPPPIPFSELLGMSVGEVLNLRLPVSASATVCVDGTPKFQGIFGSAGGRAAVRITKPASIAPAGGART